MTRRPPPPDACPLLPSLALAAALRTRWRAWLERRRTDAGWSPLEEPEET